MSTRALFVFLLLFGFTAGAALLVPSFTHPHLADSLSRTDQTIYLPYIARQPTASLEWSQHGHDAQHTSYTSQTVDPPWRWRWAWNGPNASGGVGKTTSGGSLPRNVQPVTGEGRVYMAAGTDGVYALSETSGAVVWQRGGIGSILSTVAYDRDTQAVFAVSSNGNLYRLNASTGAISGQFSSGQSSSLPLPPVVTSDRVLFSMGGSVFALNKFNLQLIWTYASGATVATPPAFSDR